MQFIIPPNVISIGKGVISKCESLEKISIPPVIDYIENDQFKNFTKLKEFIIPKSVNKIGSNAFYECSSITKIEIPSSVEIIDKYSFYKCSSLVEIKIPDSVKQIGQYSFAFCNSLKTITLSSSLNVIENNLFEGCSLLEQIIIPDSAQYINELAFYKCESLKEVKIPSSVKTIKFGAFSNCSSLENVLFDLPSNLTIIDSYAFENCFVLKKIEIPPSVKSIRRFSFKDCKALENISIDPSIKIIQPNVFDGCESLDLNLIPSSAQNIKIPQKENLPIIKMVLLGASAVGKSAILQRYNENCFDEGITITIGVEFKTKIIDIDGNQVKLQIWDTAGVERFHSITKSYYRNMMCALIVLDLTSPESVDTAINYFNEISELEGLIPTVFLGNKSDNRYRKIVGKIDKLEEFEKRYKTKYFEVSAKEDKNINEAINYGAIEAFYKFIYDNQILNIDSGSNNKSIDISKEEKKRSKC